MKKKISCSKKKCVNPKHYLMTRKSFFVCERNDIWNFWLCKCLKVTTAKKLLTSSRWILSDASPSFHFLVFLTNLIVDNTPTFQKDNSSKTNWPIRNGRQKIYYFYHSLVKNNLLRTFNQTPIDYFICSKFDYFIFRVFERRESTKDRSYLTTWKLSPLISRPYRV